MVDAIEILLSKLIKNIPVLQGCERNILRILLIVMECPLLEKKDLEELLLKKLCQILGSLRSKPRGVMGEWLSQYPQEQFKRLVRIFKRFLANHFFPGPKPDEAVVYSVKILSMLCHANEKHSPPLVPVDDFYVPELCSGLQFKEEYKNWTENTSGETFSYFNFPFLFDPSSKARIIKLDAIHEMSHQFEQAYVSQALISHAQKFLEDSSHLSDLEKHMKSAANPFLVLELHRETLLQDTIEQLRRKALDLKKPIRIKFIGGGEEGMDQGGVQKEFFSFAIMELLDPAHGLFLYDEETRQSWINRSSVEPDSFYELFGILLGLAIYNGIMLGVSLPLVFYMKLLDETITIHDFEDSFPSLGKGLHSLLKWSDGDVEDVFMRSFEITYSDFSGVRNVQLVDDGENIPVTNSNREGNL